MASTPEYFAICGASLSTGLATHLVKFAVVLTESEALSEHHAASRITMHHGLPREVAEVRGRTLGPR